MKAQVQRTKDHEDWVITVRISDIELVAADRRVLELASMKVAEAIATRFLEERGQEVLAKLDPQAVANLSVAQAGAAINETLGRKLPDKILTIERERVVTMPQSQRWWHR